MVFLDLFLGESKHLSFLRLQFMFSQFRSHLAHEALGLQSGKCWGTAAPPEGSLLHPRFYEPTRVVEFCQGASSRLGPEDSHKSVSGHLMQSSSASRADTSIGPYAPTIYKPLTRRRSTSRLGLLCANSGRGQVGERERGEVQGLGGVWRAPAWGQLPTLP